MYVIRSGCNTVVSINTGNEKGVRVSATAVEEVQQQVVVQVGQLSPPSSPKVQYRSCDASPALRCDCQPRSM
jgi:hypothetical protein